MTIQTRFHNAGRKGLAELGNIRFSRGWSLARVAARRASAVFT